MMQNPKFVVAIFVFLINSVGVLASDKENGYDEYVSIYVNKKIKNNLKDLVIFEKSKFSAVDNTLKFKGIITVLFINNTLPFQHTPLIIKVTAVPYFKILNNKTLKNIFSTIKFKTVAIIKPFPSLSNLTI